MVLIPNKREFLANRLRDCGVIRLIEASARRRALLVLTYHRIANPASSEDYGPIFSASPEALEQTLRALKISHKIVNMAELVSLAESGFQVDEPVALVTFDDGYRDNFTAALPILRDLKIPATFFLTTGFLEGASLPWWDRIARIVRRSKVERLTLDQPMPVIVDLRNTPRDQAVFEVVRAYRDSPVDDEEAYFAALEDRAEIHVDVEESARGQFLTWGEVRAAADSGIDIGAHGQTHRRLSWLSEAEQRQELERSRAILQSHLNREILALAYPYGWFGAFDATTERLARETGYRVAFSAGEGVNRSGRTNPFAIRRIGIGFADSPALLRARWTLLESVGRSFL
jgi:peptidoglycan/xylan/chitin deacetylase (PgdA/CDA1 family)